jgi:phage terminase large subunit
MARRNPERWFSQVLTVNDTKVIPQAVLDQEREEIIIKDGNDALYQQEYMCSFKVPIAGAYYGTLMMQAREQKRIGFVPYDESMPVDTWWDLGVGDSTAIWFVQCIGKEIRLIDHYETSGEGLPHYIRKLQEKGYIYGRHIAPHDIQVREFSTGKSRYEVAQSLGISFEIAPKLSLEDGIDAVRIILPRCWFDEEKTRRGTNALITYHKAFDEKNKIYKDRPEHDWSSHSCDAFRMGAVMYQEELDTGDFPDDTQPFSSI